ncbi:MAG: prolipoprotein diacylglyceryl transferase [Mycolicibacterium frederiksbergense]|nr:prolipoprotein diacylglyceryl transferase [Mycolicibacterium frederiksbergense]
MLPFLEHPTWSIGPLTIHAFGVSVAAAVWYGFTAAQRRFTDLKLDANIGQQLGTWMLAGGILGAHLFSVLFYFPSKLREDPWLTLRLWEDISSFGGMVGGVLGAILFFVVRMPERTWSERLAYLDAVAFVFPGALAIGRIGCALAHDHPGSVSAFPLAISLNTDTAQAFVQALYADAGRALPTDFANLGFHDLGLYECLYLALVVVPAFWYLNRRTRPAGFYIAAFGALYLPVRLALDSLRIADARYVGLTPAQWLAAILLFVLPLVTLGRRTLAYAIGGSVVLTTLWACWSGS